MGHRLSKIYTRTGDAGDTGMADGARLGKDHPRVHVLGELDELSSVLGLIRCELAEDHPVATAICQIQHELLDLGAEFALPHLQLLASVAVTRLEQEIDDMNVLLGPLKEFLLPGGTRAAASAHLARAVARRLERRMVELGRLETLPGAALPYVNRLSDWLFVAARHLLHGAGGRELLWHHQRR